MSDLSNLLGDLYGDSSNPDGPPIRREPAAYERNDFAGRTDDALSAALSAALAEPAPQAVAMPEVPVAPAPSYVAAPVEAAPRGAWTAAPEAAPPVAVSVPVPAMAGPRMWLVGDDDIVPIASGGKKRK